MKYGILPVDLGIFDIKCEEMMFYQYLPIKLKGKQFDEIEPRLKCFEPLINAVYNNITFSQWCDSYIYLTAKHIFVNDDHCGNRPGWHTDGFMSDDINYIWCDSEPTVFSDCGLTDLTQEHEKSLLEMEAFVNYSCEVTYPVKSLLKLDQFVIHRSPENCKSGYRTFVKISVSNEKYNLIGNSHNHLLDYNWDMQPRKAERNHPISL